LRRPERFEELLRACACDFHGRKGFADKPYPQLERLARALSAASRVNAGALAKSETDPVKIRQKIRTARLSAIRQAEQS